MRKSKLKNIIQMAERKDFSVMIYENGNYKTLTQRYINAIGLDTLCNYKIDNDIIIIDYFKINKLDYKIEYKNDYLIIKINNIELWGFYTTLEEIKENSIEGLLWDCQVMSEALCLLYLDNDKRIINNILNYSIICNIEYNKAETKRLEKAIFRALKQIQRKGAK